MSAEASPVIVGIGEILWDVFPDGERFGGAPANFACHAASLVGRSQIVSAIGADDLGKRALEKLREKQVDITNVAVLQGYRTGTVQVELDEHGAASYEFGKDDAWDHLVSSSETDELARQTNAVCFGTLGQRSSQSRQMIEGFVSSVPADAWRIFDINLRPPFYSFDVIEDSLRLANLLKLNSDELQIVSKYFEIEGDPVSQMKQIANRFDLRVVALSRGAEGAMLVRGEEVSEFHGAETEVIDTVGAGDAFTSVLACGLLAGKELDEINQVACEVAAYVCSKPGGTPELPQTLTEKLG